VGEDVEGGVLAHHDSAASFLIKVGGYTILVENTTSGKEFFVSVLAFGWQFDLHFASKESVSTHYWPTNMLRKRAAKS
jgi:hypothetical protein